MRKKTASRRDAIIAAAAEVFNEFGYERASMSAIGMRVGYSKVTLYSYFDSKEDLFFAVLNSKYEIELADICAVLCNSTEEISAVLNNFGRRLVEFLYTPQAQKLRRLVISNAAKSALGRKCYEMVPLKICKEIALYLRAAMNSGVLRRADEMAAAKQLKALYEAYFIDRFMCYSEPTVSLEEIKAAVQEAVDVFLLAYKIT